MKVVIAPDKFKGCLSAAEAAPAMADGVRAAAGASGKSVEIDCCPMADGGEGTARVIVESAAGYFRSVEVWGPLGDRRIAAEIGFIDNGQTAVLDMAQAAGLMLLPVDQRNPMLTTTFGVGEMMLAAARLGARNILIGAGGSATIDGGIGCTQACGLPVILDQGEPSDPREPLRGEDVARVVLIKHGRGSAVESCRITVAVDVDNPLLGERGAAVTFGLQKGATAAQVVQLEAALRQLATRTARLDIADQPGAGAAGGLAFGLAAYLGANIVPGADRVMEANGLAARLIGADLCLTGEGRFDASSLGGKTPVAVARICRASNIPCCVLAGAVEITAAPMQSAGIDEAIAISDPGRSVVESMTHAAALLKRSTESLLWRRLKGD